MCVCVCVWEGAHSRGMNLGHTRISMNFYLIEGVKVYAKVIALTDYEFLTYLDSWGTTTNNYIMNATSTTHQRNTH